MHFHCYTYTRLICKQIVKMKEPESDITFENLDTLWKAVLLNDGSKTKEWFESHAFCTANHGRDITRYSGSSQNEMMNLLVEAVKTHNDNAFCTMLQYTCHNTVLYQAKDIDDRLLAQVVLSKGSTLCLRILAQCGFDINWVDAEGMTPLLYLIYKKSVSRVKEYEDKLDFMIQNGVNVNKQGDRTWAFAPIHIAVLYSSGTETVKALIDAGANVNLQCNNSLSTPLCFAVERGSTEMLDLLFEHGADPSITDLLGDTPLHGAAVHQTKGSSLLKVFIYWNISMTLPNTSGLTPLIWILSDWKTVKKQRIQMLLKAGAGCTMAQWLKIRGVKSVDPKWEHKLAEIEDMLDFYAFRPRSLHDLTCFRIRALLGRDLPRLVHRLPVPDCLKRHIHLEHYFGKRDSQVVNMGSGRLVP